MNIFSYVAIGGISIYQIVLSPILRSLLGIKNSCRFSPTCSEYAKRSIRSKGIVKGSSLAIKRLLSCQPFGTI